MTFTMKVDPYLRNYVTVKFSGEERSSTSMVNINGEQIGYIRNGDYEAINRGWTLPNRFFYYTLMLPHESTVGKETVETANHVAERLHHFSSTPVALDCDTRRTDQSVCLDRQCMEPLLLQALTTFSLVYQLSIKT